MGILLGMGCMEAIYGLIGLKGLSLLIIKIVARLNRMEILVFGRKTEFSYKRSVFS